MKLCENCGNSHLGTVGSGRFCSLKCSRGFSTKAKRKEISLQVSKALTKERETFSNICIICEKEFISKVYPHSACSGKCRAQMQKGKKKASGELRKKGSGGLRDGGGKSKQIDYVSRFGESMKLNHDEIRVAKILDSSKYSWKRNWKGFTYSENRKFFPDFWVKELDLYIEFKGWLTDSMREKMKNANVPNFLVVVGNDKRFVNDGISLEQLENFLRE
jgi:hypothetical protein